MAVNSETIARFNGSPKKPDSIYFPTKAFLIKRMRTNLRDVRGTLLPRPEEIGETNLVNEPLDPRREYLVTRASLPLPQSLVLYIDEQQRKNPNGKRVMVGPDYRVSVPNNAYRGESVRQPVPPLQQHEIKIRNSVNFIGSVVNAKNPLHEDIVSANVSVLGERARNLTAAQHVFCSVILSEQNGNGNRVDSDKIEKFIWPGRRDAHIKFRNMLAKLRDSLGEEAVVMYKASESSRSRIMAISFRQQASEE